MKTRISKKLLSTLISLMMIVSIVPLSAISVSAYSGGSGTKDDPYLIGTKAELIAFRNAVNNNAQTGLCAKLIDDIDLENTAWTPIGSTKNTSFYYRGIFNGNNKKITGLYINQNSSSVYQGLFGLCHFYSGEGGIKDLTVEGTVNGGDYVGGICGAIEASTNFVALENVVSKVNVNGYTYFGGIAGKANNVKAVNVYNYGTVTHWTIVNKVDRSQKRLG